MKRRTEIALGAAFVVVAALGAITIATRGRYPWRSWSSDGERVAANPPNVDEHGCPKEMAFVPTSGFCVDRWEAHVLVREGDEWRLHPYFEPLDAVTAPFRAASVRGIKPQAYISGVQAAKACGESGKRLCSMDEYRTACRGPAKTMYPYGDVRKAGVCNDARPAHPFGDVFGNAGNPELYDLVHLNDPRLDQLPSTVEPSGTNEGCVSGYGAFDMVGNLHEWIDDPEGTFLGGYYNDDEINGAGCMYMTTAHTFDYHDYSTGFRCCKTPG